jgi:hypothetical protein
LSGTIAGPGPGVLSAQREPLSFFFKFLLLLWQLRILRFVLLQDGDLGVGILPPTLRTEYRSEYRPLVEWLVPQSDIRLSPGPKTRLKPPVNSAAADFFTWQGTC